jgi:hypothetical protein
VQSAFDLTNAIALVAIAPFGADKLVDLDDRIDDRIRSKSLWTIII